MLVIHLDGGHMARPGTGGKNNSRRLQYAARAVQALHLDVIGIEQHTAAADQFDLVAFHLRVQVAILRSNDGIDTMQQRGQRRVAAQLHRQRGGFGTHTPVAQRLFAQRLARDGAREQTRPSDLRLALDDGRAKTRLGGLDRGLLTRGTRSQTNDIEIRSRLHGHMPARLKT
jgi:hypothetical protein